MPASCTCAIRHLKISPAAILRRIFFKKNEEIKQSLEKTGKLLYLFLSIFWALVPKTYFYKGAWGQDCTPLQFWDFLNSSLFPNILSLRSLGNLWGNLYNKVFILDIKFRVTFGEWKLYCNFEQFSNIMNSIAVFFRFIPWAQ